MATDGIQVAGSTGSKYYDMENSIGSDHRSCSTSESRGGRVQSMHSAISSSYHGDSSAVSSGEQSGGEGRLETSLAEAVEEYTKMEPSGYSAMFPCDTASTGTATTATTVVRAPTVTPETRPVTNHPSDRHKILQRILDDEYRYIMSLKDIKKIYALPLTHHSMKLLDLSKAQEIFFQLPEITVHHEFFYEQLRRRSMAWSTHQLLGDILLQLFHKPGLFSAYASYLDNFYHALEIVQDTRATRPAFSKLLDKLRSKSSQMSLEELLHMPLERIPVYLELLRDLIKQTTQDDPDYTYLYLAKDEIEKLIEKLSERRKQADRAFSVKMLEKKISGLPRTLVAPQRCIVSHEKVRELDIMTDRSDERYLVVMSDILLCLKPLSRNSSSVISSVSTEFQYLWDCLVTDVEINNDANESQTAATSEDPTEDNEGSQALKDDLLILEQIDTLRMRLKGSYSAVRFDKLVEIREKLKKEIADRQSSEESRRGKTLDIIRPINSPCTSTQFHRIVFHSAAKRSQWKRDFQNRQQMMHHTKDLDWCQIGEQEVVSQERLADLLPVIKHMTPIGLTTPSQFSVECAAANADFTCPVTQDILYRIMSNPDKLDTYENVRETDEIPLLPPETPLYTENLTPTNGHTTQPTNLVPELHPNTVVSSATTPPSAARAALPRIIAPQSRSPYAINNTTTSPTQPESPQYTRFNRDNVLPQDTEHVASRGDHVASRGEHVVPLRAHSYDGGSLEDPPPVPGNHPLKVTREAKLKADRQSIIELIESTVSQDVGVRGEDEPEDLYETPYEISLLRQEKKKLMRSKSVDDNLLHSSTELIQQQDSGDSSAEVSLDIPNQAGPINVEELRLDDRADESFNLELTESQELNSFIAPRRESLKPPESVGGPLLVDKYGQVYTDKITSLISGPVPSQTEGLPDLDQSIAESLLELDSDDEDDTPNMYDSQLNIACYQPVSLDTTISSNSTTQQSVSVGASTPIALPQIQVPTSELYPPENINTVTDSLYQNLNSTTQKLRTTVIRRESSKRSINRGPKITQSQISLASDDWQEQDTYENINEEGEEFDLKSTDVFLCGHGSNGKGEIVVLRLTEPTPHIALDIPLQDSQVLCCHMVPGKTNTIWVGTQDARLLVYQMSDPSSTLLERGNLQGGPVICISHIEDSVFVGTSEGYIHVFTRDATVNEWCDNDPLTKQLGSSSICAMLPIGGHMWCSCGCQIFVISPDTVTVEHLFSTHNNTTAQVYKMVNSGSGVWLAIRNSPVIRLFHAKTGEHLEDYDISTVVHHLFTGSHSAARRRRAENVRVTALLASSSTGALWIGTSSGVVVVVPISKPPVAPRICGPPFLSYMGHYDGVRFLMQAQSRIRKLIPKESTEHENVFEEITSQVIISCGKGMEDFRDHDSIRQTEQIQNSSYLIIWHYPDSV